MNPSRPHRRSRGRLLAALSLALGVVIAAVSGGIGATAQTAPAPTGGNAAAAPTTQPTLILYDTTGPYGFLGEQYATLTANLVSRFGAWRAKPVRNYVAGELNSHGAVIYLGSTYDEPIPTAFLDDARTTTKPVLWVSWNIWQFFNRAFAATGQYVANTRGFEYGSFDYSPVGMVRYKGQTIARYAGNAGGIIPTTITDPTKATVLAEALRPDGTTFPWATRSGNFFYVGEMPLAYIAENDRYLIFADLLYEVLAPNTPTRRRALVRLEDISPDSDPASLRAVADVLAAEGVPFAFQIIPFYRDPRGVYNGGVREEATLQQRPELVAALNYMISKGGTPVMHGYTHQLYEGNVANPYNGVSGDDFEFYRAFVDAENYVRLTGWVPEERNTKWVTDRIDAGLRLINQVRLPRPQIWTTPHYSGSPTTYAGIRARFNTVLERRLYFNGTLSGTAPQANRLIGQFFPYPVQDVYGQFVLPENLGNHEPVEFNNNPPRFPADIVANARANLVVRDGWASFFWHPYLANDPNNPQGVEALREIVRGIKGLGYTFVAPASVTIR